MEKKLQIRYVIGFTVEPRDPYFKVRELPLN